MPESPIGEFEQLVMLALLRVGDEAYGVPIHAELSTRARRAVNLAAVYKTLERLEAKGYVSSRVGEPTPERGGRRRKYFTLEAPGRQALRESLAALRRMTAGLELPGGGL
ncbi:MAG: PadR family transcriptional regulator [Acidobacteriota bacterium]|nr:PadR family transcriptional regulator [Acidobacteriota bacterium]